MAERGFAVPGAHRPPDHEDARMHGFLAASPAEQVATMRAWGLPPAVALMLVNACAARCFFCANRGTVDVPASEITGWEAIRRHLDARPEGVERLLVGGNEPLLHPHREAWFAHARQAGFTSIELMTSGLGLADEAALDRWVDAGLSAVAVPIYAADAALHDAVVGKAAFDTLCRGLDAARARGVEVWLHTLALKRTIDGLADLVDLACDRWQAPLAIAPLREKDDLFVYDEESVGLRALEGALDVLPADRTVSLVGWPDCIAADRPRGSHLVIEMYFRTQRRTYVDACTPCARRADCPGIVEALRKREAGRVRPFGGA